VSVGKEEPLTLIFLMTFADFDSLQLFGAFSAGVVMGTSYLEYVSKHAQLICIHHHIRSTSTNRHSSGAAPLYLRSLISPVCP